MRQSINRRADWPDQADVVVVGGGPAGIAAALTLIKHGCQVVVVEKSRYEAVRIGETFPPVINQVLAEIGTLDDFQSYGHLPSNGIRSYWGQAVPIERSFIFDPYGVGWHVDRQAFDANLARLAQSRGITVATGTAFQKCHQNDSGLWTLTLASDQGRFHIHSDFLVDATGRASVVARHLGCRRQQFDRLVGVAGFYDGVEPDNNVEAITLIETTSEGWWYSAHLPGRRLVVAFMTDADLCARASLSENDTWLETLKQATHTHDRTLAYTLAGPVRIMAASTSYLEECHGEDWLAVGDAAFAFDPLSGDGVYRALKSGSNGGQAIIAARSGSVTAFEMYSERESKIFTQYRQQQEKFYEQERRWPDSVFWKRRLAVVAT